ncbi:MAG: right-handed parallel beta-helix repeat-containing protein [Phycisphaerales bacterium]|nr:MAG: right-handed parallel beta-helix repeat-containing protein [Phycisphaerales bacterium]
MRRTLWTILCLINAGWACAQTLYAPGERHSGMQSPIYAAVDGNPAQTTYEKGPLWNTGSNRQYQTIQAAIDDSNAGDVIVVAIGSHSGPGNRDIDFKGRAVTLRSVEPLDPLVVAATVIDCGGSNTDPHRGFFFHTGEDANAVVDGLTITNGAGCYDGGAVKCWNHSSPTIRNCLITGNLSGGRAGGIFCAHYSNPAITNCIFTGNAATTGYGGAICCFDNSSPTITDCIMTDNGAMGSGHHGGAVYCHDAGNATLVNCFISGNTAGHRGGGFSAYWSDPTLINCTIVGNASLEGGGVSSFRQSNPTLVNCIIRENRALDGPQIALINTIRIWGVSIPTEMTVLFCDVQGGSAAATVDASCTLNWGQGNIDLDPQFVEPGYWSDANAPWDANYSDYVVGDFHLPPDSPCVNAGDNTSIPAAVTRDLDGEQRVFAERVDLGADEAVAEIADLNGDGVVDFLDLAVLADEWLKNAAGLRADFSENGRVELSDYTHLARWWKWTAKWRR